MNVTLERTHIDKAHEFLRGEFPGFAGNQLFLFLVYEEQEWFHKQFPPGVDHEPYTSACVAYAVSEVEMETGQPFDWGDDE